MHSASSISQRFVRWSRVAGVALVVLGVSVVVGWWLGSPVVTSMASATTKPNTALGMAMLGVALLLPPRLSSTPTRIVALLVGLLAIASLLEFLANADIGIDTLLVRSGARGTSLPGSMRMSAVTACGFLMLTVGLCVRDVDGPVPRWLWGAMPVGVFGIAFFRLLAIIFEAEAALPWLAQFNGVALPTVVGFLVASTAMLASRPHAGGVRLVTAEGVVGYHARRLLLFSVPVVIAVALIAHAGHRAGFYNPGFRGALLGSMVLGLSTLATWRTFHRLAAAEERSAAALRALNDGRQSLERIVAERTTELQAANAQLRSSGEPLRLLVESTRDFAILQLDVSGTIVLWNRAAERINGFGAGDIAGQPISVFYEQPDIDAGVPGHELAIAAQEGRFAGEGWRRRKDGTRFWANAVITALRQPDGTLIGFFKITQDLTERRANEQALRESERRLRIALDNVGIGFWDYSLPTGFVWWDKNLLAILGYDEGELPPRLETWVQTLHPDDRAQAVAALERHLADPSLPYDIEYRGLLRDGGWVWVNSRGRVVERDDAGAPIRMMGTVEDITARKRASELLLAQNRDLQNLLHVTSHDLREPLRGIKGFARLLDELAGSKLDERETDYLKRLGAAAARLDSLLDDITLVARVRQFEIPNEAVPGNDFVAEALSRLDDRIRQTRAIIRVADPLPAIVANRLWATQAIYNLVLNALKFTEPGRVPEIDIDGVVMPNERGVVVRDRGPGVAPEHGERIFELFQRAVGRSIEGTGAGLAIVRQVATRHGGRAWYAPRPGGGSEFSITFNAPSPPTGRS